MSTPCISCRFHAVFGRRPESFPECECIVDLGADLPVFSDDLFALPSADADPCPEGGPECIEE